MANIPFTHLNITDGTSQVNKTNMQTLFDALRKVVAKANRGATEYLDADLVAGTTPGARGLTALASATVLDADTVGGKNLTAQRKLSDGLICAPKANLPEYPDNVAGTTLLERNWTATAPWDTISSYGTLSFTTEYLRNTWSTGMASIQSFRKLSISYAAGLSWRIRVRASRARSFKMYQFVGAYAEIKTVSLTTEWQVVDATFTGTATGIKFESIDTPQNGDTVDINFSYIGNGNHDSLALDASGNGNHGTVFGCTPVAGITGRALIYDGINDVSIHSIPAIGNQYTYSMWINSSDLAKSGMFASNAGPDFFPQMRNVNASSLTVNYQDTGGTTRSMNYTVTRIVGTWYLVTFTHNGTTGTLYINGVAVATSAFAAKAIPATTLRLGSYATGGIEFAGTIDDPRIYNRALSAAEIWELYQNPGGNCINDMEVSVTPTMNSIVARGPDGRIRLSTHTPATAGAAGTVGQIAYDASYIYICTATNTWKRVAIASW